MRNDRGDIEITITIHVSDRHMDRAGKAQQLMALEAKSALILHPPDLSLVVAELSDGEVDIAVVIEITRLDIGDTGYAVEERVVLESLIPAIFEQSDGFLSFRCSTGSAPSRRREDRCRRPNRHRRV